MVDDQRYIGPAAYRGALADAVRSRGGEIREDFPAGGPGWSAALDATGDPLR